MNIICFPKGPLTSNMYLTYIDDELFVIDPSVDPDSLDMAIPHVTAILITHGHYDHIKYVEKWHNLYPETPIYMSSGDSSLMSDPEANCSFMDGIVKIFDFPHNDPSEILFSGAFTIKTIQTPGHTMGSVCYLFTEGCSDYLFTGDTVFQGSVGRTDMPGGSFDLMKQSVELISAFPPETIIYPGHGPDSTVGYELKFNPFFAL